MSRRMSVVGPPFVAALVAGLLVPGATSRAAPRVCGGVPATIVGTSGDEGIVGTGGDDVIVGLQGRDRIAGRGGDDLICGSRGYDVLRGGRGDDAIEGAGGNDAIEGQIGADSVRGNTGNDIVRGGAGRDAARGSYGSDDVEGGGGRDSISGGVGNDRASARDGVSGNDDVDGGSGDDTCSIDADDERRSCERGEDEFTSLAISVRDDFFSPSSLIVPQGGSVTWTFNGDDAHTATDASGMGLFNSGSKSSGFYSFTFKGSGKYPFRCLIHDNMRGNLSVPLLASPASGSTATSFTITWSSAAPASGYVFDVQVKRPGSASFVNWKIAQTSVSSSFRADAGTGTYAFRARVRRTSSNKTTGWSATKSITVG